MIDWYEYTVKFHQETFKAEGDLNILDSEYKRELASLWRLEIDISNGGYLQFLGNWKVQSYSYASSGLRKIGAHKMNSIICRCQKIVDNYNFTSDYSCSELKSKLKSNDYKMVLDLSCEYIMHPEAVDRMTIDYYFVKMGYE